MEHNLAFFPYFTDKNNPGFWWLKSKVILLFCKIFDSGLNFLSAGKGASWQGPQLGRGSMQLEGLNL
jgi:hypothetical protein